MAITMGSVSIEKKCVAIVMFGPATETSGMKPAEYYQVTIDPALVSPEGQYIRFGKHDGDEIQGWQRIEAMTICEILTDYADDGSVEIPKTSGPVEMRIVSAPDPS